MELKKSAKIGKNEKTQHLIRCFKSKKQFKINFKNFCQFLAHFEQKVAKKHVFCDHLKNCAFWSKFDITNVFLLQIPFLKMYTCMHFYEFVKKLCYKMKMPKYDV